MGAHSSSKLDGSATGFLNGGRRREKRDGKVRGEKMQLRSRSDGREEEDGDEVDGWRADRLASAQEAGRKEMREGIGEQVRRRGKRR